MNTEEIYLVVYSFESTRLFGEGGEERIGDEYICFILGWPRENGDVKKPDVPDAFGTDV